VPLKGGSRAPGARAERPRGGGPRTRRQLNPQVSSKAKNTLFRVPNPKVLYPDPQNTSRFEMAAPESPRHTPEIVELPPGSDQALAFEFAFAV